MIKQPTSKPNFSELEDQMLDFWDKDSTFEKSLNLRKGNETYRFYDGPPFMSGMPHWGTLLSSVYKDVYPRFQSMKGKYVPVLWGWDCHGLPIEAKVEKQLGLEGRADILEHGLDDFIQKCYDWNRVGIDNWRWYIRKMGRWADMDNAYRTLDQDYMESVWWVFKELWDKGLIYKGKKVLMYSTDSGTPVSDFEVSMDSDNYRDTEDIAVTVKFKLDEKIVDSEKDNFLLIWTTTPWTIASNFAIAVNADAEYVGIEDGTGIYFLAKDLAESVFGKELSELKVVTEMKGSELEGKSYEQIYNFFPSGENDHKVYTSEYVSISDGTGMLHVAPAYGEADFNMGQEWNLSDHSNINSAGIIKNGSFKGKYLRDANPLIANELKEMNRLFKQEVYTHRLPYYRYDNPLIYMAIDNFFIDVSNLRSQLLETNKEINWYPSHFGEKRFVNVIETAPDWSISRNRFWGTVMPIWKSEDEDTIAVSSRAELMEYVNSDDSDNYMQEFTLILDKEAGLEVLETQMQAAASNKTQKVEIHGSQDEISYLRKKYFGETEQESKVRPVENSRKFYMYNGEFVDMHRPYIDAVEFVHDGKKYKRIEETLDVWMDSGSMPYAQTHYPFEKQEEFEESFPADFISEYTGQIRAWFNILHILSNALKNKPAFKNVLVSGVLAGTDGRKMSKSFGNYPDPRETLENLGGEPVRLYLLGGPLARGNDMSFSNEELNIQTREYTLPFWNSFKYLATYANIHEWEPSEKLAHNDRTVWDDLHPWDHITFDEIDNELDAWILVKLQNLIGIVNESLENYDSPKAIKELKQFLNDLSGWYIRRSRDRFVNGEIRAMEVLYYVLVEFSKLSAPITPMISEYIYKELTSDLDLPKSVHLCDYPIVDTRFIEKYSSVEAEMSMVRTIVDLGHSIRTQNALKVRQPLAMMHVKFNEELNQSGVALLPWMEIMLREELNLKQIAEAPMLKDDNGWIANEDEKNGVGISIDSNLTEELQKEGAIREVIRFIQSKRKKENFEIGEVVQVEIKVSTESINDLFSTEVIEDINQTTKVNIKSVDIVDLSEGSKVLDGFVSINFMI